MKTTFKIPSEWTELIDKDLKNANMWVQVSQKVAANRKELTDFVEKMFGCIVCMDIVYKPVTTHCSHNICLPCLKRSFEADTFKCSAYREELPKDLAKDQNINSEAMAVLNKIFPGYEVGR